MLRISLSTLAIVSVASLAIAASPIADRQALMKANGGATKALVGMMKGETAFNLDAVKKALTTYQQNADSFIALFPEGSDKGEKTSASPKIWSDMAGFKAANDKFKADATAALAAITDEASFKATVPGVLKNCGACHEAYRLKD